MLLHGNDNLKQNEIELILFYVFSITQIQNKLPGRKVDKSENIHPKERNKKKIRLSGNN